MEVDLFTLNTYNALIHSKAKRIQKQYWPKAFLPSFYSSGFSTSLESITVCFLPEEYFNTGQ